MDKQFRPILAGKFEPEKADFPYLASPKIDGIRCLFINGQALSRTLKPFPNSWLQYLARSMPQNIDGELLLHGDESFKAVQSAAMTKEAINSKFKFVAFDCFDDPSAPLHLRLRHLMCKADQYFGSMELENWAIQKEINTMGQLTNYHNACVEYGYEGIMLRKADSPYKFGRSTAKQGYLLKVKKFLDGEAVIVGFEELERHIGEATTNILGLTERDHKKENKVKGNVLGALICDHPIFGQFSIGSGFTGYERSEIWHNKESYVGNLAKFQYFEVTHKGKPRFPTFKGFRSTMGGKIV